MEAFSALLAICAGNSPVTGEFPIQRPVTRSFDVFFDLHLNKQSWGWWIETPSRSLWRHCNGYKCRAKHAVTRARVLSQPQYLFSVFSWFWLGTFSGLGSCGVCHPQMAMSIVAYTCRLNKASSTFFVDSSFLYVSQTLFMILWKGFQPLWQHDSPRRGAIISTVETDNS